MSTSSLFDVVSAEIVSLHRFFVEWYDGSTADRTNFDRFERAMGGDMHMIPPSGAFLGRDAVVAHVRRNRGAFRSQYTIDISEIRPVWESDGSILVTYVERQNRSGVKTARRASALFTRNSSAPGGVEWRHLHETWMQTAET